MALFPPASPPASPPAFPPAPDRGTPPRQIPPPPPPPGTWRPRGRRVAGRRAALVLTLLGGVTAAAACSGGSDGAATPTGPAPSPTARPAVASLAELAKRAVGKAMTVTYATVATDGRTATVTIAVRPPSFRVDVRDPDAVAVLISTPQAAVSCREPTDGDPTCFTVAGPGGSLPRLFDPAVQRVLLDDLDVLAEAPTWLDVTGPESHPATADAPATRCFSVSADTAAADPRAARFDAGSWCLADDGLPVSMRFASGTLTLTATGPGPTDAALTPPVTPQPLPTTSPNAGPDASSAPALPPG